MVLDSLNPHFISLNETHLAEDSLDINGFTWFGHKRVAHRNAVKASGGVGLCVKNTIFDQFVVNIVDKAHDGIICIYFEHRVSQYSFAIISCYLSPESSAWGRDADSFFNHLLTMLYMLSHSVDAVYICGDLNSRIAELKDYSDMDDIPTRTSLDTGVNKHGQAFIDFLKDSKCCVLNGRLNPENDNFTSVSIRGRAVVDYIVTPHDDLKNCLEFGVYTPSELISRLGNEAVKLLDERSKMPDHSVLCLRFQAGESTSEYPTDPQQNVKRQCRLRHIPANFLSDEMCCQTLREITYQLENGSRNQDNVDQCYDRLCALLHKEIDKHCAPRNRNVKKYRVKQPYWNNELNGLWGNLRRVEKIFLKCKDLSRRSTLRDEFKRCQFIFDRRLTFFKRRFKRGQALQLEQAHFTNPQLFWREINKLGPNKSRTIPMQIVLENGDSLYEVGEILKKWENEYRSLYACCNPPMFNEQFLQDINKLKCDLEVVMSDRPTDQYQSPLNDDITREEVKEAIDRARLNKAVGVEELTNEVLKSPYLLTVLHCLCQICFNIGITPSEWDKSIIVPIPKSIKADPRIPLNYRGVSLLSTVYKLYSGVLNKRLTHYLESNKVLVDEQNGFRRNRACIDHIFVISSVVRARLEDGEDTFVCFVDFKKAFDWINRDLMNYKLLNAGVRGKFYNALKALYKAPVACLQINDLKTGWFPTPFGVKQGDVLSPTLFALFINDLALEIKQANLGVPIEDFNLTILLYADDIALVAENPVNLQKMLTIMSSWCNKWRLTINEEKTQIMHFRREWVQQCNYTFVFGSKPLNYTPSYKYLGFVFDEHLRFSEGRKILSESASRALGAVLSKTKLCPDLGFATFTKLYNSMVESVLLYAAGVWGFEETKECKAIQNRAIRYFLGVHKYTTKLAIEGDMGWDSCLTKQRCEMVRLWNRLTQLPEERLTKKIFNWSRMQNHPWIRELSSIFSLGDLNMYFMNNLQCNINLIKMKLSTKYQEQWKVEIWKKPKLRNYVQIKEEYFTEPYVAFNLEKGQRSLCAQLRAGVLPLAVEVGRYKAIPEELRLCTLCNLGVVEDEFHFVFHCPLYDSLRSVLFEKMQVKNPDLFWLPEANMLSWLFAEEVFALGKFIEKAWQLRWRMLYPLT